MIILVCVYCRPQLVSACQALVVCRTKVAHLTSPDIRDLGLTVARSLVPGYHPLYMGHRLRALGGRRLWEVPQRLGREQPQSGGSNPAPHPYP